MKHSIKQVYFQSDDFVKMIQLEKDHFMAQGVASKDCEAIYLMCLFFGFQALCLEHVCALREHEEKSKMSVEHMTQPSRPVLFNEYTVFGSRDNSGAEMPAELWENKTDKRAIKGLFYRDAYSLGKSFYLSDTQCLSHTFSLPIIGNWEGLCSKLHQVTATKKKLWVKHPSKLNM